MIRSITRVKFTFSTGAGSAVGFIGLGNMGGPMALNLKTKGGYDVIAFDAIPETRKEYAAKGLKVVDSLDAVARGARQIVTMLPNHHIVKKVCEGDSGLFALLTRGGTGSSAPLIMDCSTIAPQAAVELHASAKRAGVEFVDSPVSGGVGAATAGTLTFMVGANDKTVFERVQDVLKHMGKAVINCEKEGAGQIAKCCNNMALGIEMIAVSEALALGKRLGIDSKVLSQIMNVSSAQCWSLSLYNPCPGVLPNVPSARGYTGGFASELMLKDLGIAVEAAQTSGSSVPLGNHAKAIYEQLVKEGHNRTDFSYVYEALLNNKIKA